MALINCPECGKQISDKAERCIHCGCPIDNPSDVIEKNSDAGHVNSPFRSIIFTKNKINCFINSVYNWFTFII